MLFRSVEDQQDAVLVADRPQPLQVALQGGAGRGDLLALGADRAGEGVLGLGDPLLALGLLLPRVLALIRARG